MAIPTSSEITQAAAILRAGGLVAFPTETVYGLGANAEDEVAVRKIFAAKGRPADHPVIVHLGEMMDMVHWSGQIPKQAWHLAETYWPGPLTLILPRLPRAKDVVTGGLDTVGLRIPSHPVAQSLLREFGGAIAAPSANRFGRVSPTRAEHVREEFGDQVEMILDGGDCEVGLESTIVDFSGEEPVILRPGAITLEQVEAVCGMRLASPETSQTRSPGRLASHYAPLAAVEIVDGPQLAQRAADLLARGKRVAVLTVGKVTLPSGIQVISLSADSAGIAHDLYSALREADKMRCDFVLVSLPAEVGIGAAIADRLRKAAAPRVT